MLATLDWWVIGTYVFLLLALGGVLSRRQQSGADYFVAGRSERPFNIHLLGISLKDSSPLDKTTAATDYGRNC